MSAPLPGNSFLAIIRDDRAVAGCVDPRTGGSPSVGAEAPPSIGGPAHRLGGGADRRRGRAGGEARRGRRDPGAGTDGHDGLLAAAGAYRESAAGRMDAYR